MARTVMVIGAHPDDDEIKAGGTAALWRREGWRVVFVSMTNGDAGHHEIGGIELARRRRQEASAAAAVIGAESVILDNHDGELMPTLENRKTLIRLIRGYGPEVILTHRPNDYHPDHRYTSLLVQDTAYLLTVPNVCTDTPALARDPVIFYMQDGFQKPLPHRPDVVVPIDDVYEQKIEMLHCHTSQVYEWLPWHDGKLGEVPASEADRRAWLRTWLAPRFRREREHNNARLESQFGNAAARIQYAESFEACEYGRRVSAEEMAGLFPVKNTV